MSQLAGSLNPILQAASFIGVVYKLTKKFVNNRNDLDSSQTTIHLILYTYLSPALTGFKNYIISILTI